MSVKYAVDTLVDMFYNAESQEHKHKKEELPAMSPAQTETDDPGTIIRHGREEHGLTQEQLAELVGADPRTIQRWEADECIPWPLYIKRIVSAMPEIAESLYEAIKKNLLCFT